LEGFETSQKQRERYLAENEGVTPVFGDVSGTNIAFTHLSNWKKLDFGSIPTWRIIQVPWWFITMVIVSPLI